MNITIPTIEDFEKAEEEYWKINPNEKPSKIWFILNHRHEYIEDHERVNKLKELCKECTCHCHKIMDTVFECADCDYSGEYGHKLSKESIQKIMENKK